MRLLLGAEAVAAIGVDLARRLDGTAVPPAIAEQVGRIAALAAPGLDQAPAPQQRAMLGAIRALLRQATDLLAAPERPPGWSYDDPAVLDEQGRISGAFAPILADALDRHGPAASGPRQLLEVGVGAGWLALGLAVAVPDAAIVGIDVWAPALDCARANVARAGLTERISVVERDVAELDDHERFDRAWVPSPFLPRPVLEPGLARVRTALRPGGVVCFGLYAGADDPLGQPPDSPMSTSWRGPGRCRCG